MSALPASRRQSGFVLVLAIFMIISLAAIGVYLVTISTTQVEAGVQDEQGARAYQAARAGIDWGRTRCSGSRAGRSHSPPVTRPARQASN